ncbi:hypothetical protein HPB52_012771 [Rhipicephalus sanguineus]|uniref:HTH psq-type domain-containing protein n=1 Tax=Rhipicephalus sanguineus TaxID=34632 RepID=A0A9D4PE95_RHISA|nr:hypothetical protein HPB52_012771 [Rhipicephalus sanguineus]
MANGGTKRKVLDIATKQAILTELSQGVKNCELVKKYSLSKSTISTILKNKDKIISADANSTDKASAEGHLRGPNLPLRVTLYSALEMLKASWMEVTATCMQNCFRKAGFVDVGPDAPEEDRSGGDLWQCVVDSDMGERDTCWEDFITADDDADTAELCTDEGIVNEVRGKSDLNESDDDADETSEPAPTSVPVAIGYIDSLRQLVHAKGLGEEHAAALNKLETPCPQSMQELPSAREEGSLEEPREPSLQDTSAASADGRPVGKTSMVPVMGGIPEEEPQVQVPGGEEFQLPVPEEQVPVDEPEPVPVAPM